MISEALKVKKTKAVTPRTNSHEEAPIYMPVDLLTYHCTVWPLIFTYYKCKNH